MTIARRWAVTVTAEGDRPVTDDERAALAETLAGTGATVTAAGNRYGIEIAIAAGTRDEAVATASSVLAAAAERAGLPAWPVGRGHAVGDHEQSDVWGDEYGPAEGDA